MMSPEQSIALGHKIEPFLTAIRATMLETTGEEVAITLKAPSRTITYSQDAGVYFLERTLPREFTINATVGPNVKT